jgi:hypothetical protein
VNLLSKLPSRGHSQGLWVDSTSGVLGGSGSSTFQHRHDNGEQEPGSLTGASLSTRHQIATSISNRHRVLLHGSGSGVSAKLSVAAEVLTNSFGGVLINRIGATIPRYLNGDFVIVVKVDPGGLAVSASEESAFQARIGLYVAVVTTLIGAGPVVAVVSAVTSATDEEIMGTCPVRKMPFRDRSSKTEM